MVTYGSSLNEHSTSVIKDETTPPEQALAADHPNEIVDDCHDESNDNLVLMIETPQ